MNYKWKEISKSTLKIRLEKLLLKSIYVSMVCATQLYHKCQCKTKQNVLSTRLYLLFKETCRSNQNNSQSEEKCEKKECFGTMKFNHLLFSIVFEENKFTAQAKLRTQLEQCSNLEWNNYGLNGFHCSMYRTQTCIQNGRKELSPPLRPIDLISLRSANDIHCTLNSVHTAHLKWKQNQQVGVYIRECAPSIESSVQLYQIEMNVHLVASFLNWNFKLNGMNITTGIFRSCTIFNPIRTLERIYLPVWHF